VENDVQDVLPHNNGRVDATALLEERADGVARALGNDEDGVDILWVRSWYPLCSRQRRRARSLALGDPVTSKSPGF